MVKSNSISNMMSRFLDTEENGLMIGGFSTGFGKTYASCHMMLRQVLNDPDKRFYFITETKKNLPMKELYDIGKRDFNLTKDELDELVLQLKSNTDSVVDNFSDSMIPEMQKLFDEHGKDRQKISDLRNAVRSYRMAKDSRSPDQKEMARQRLDEAEREFRRCIRDMFHSDAGPFKLNRDDLFWHEWIRELYPVVDVDMKRIVLMSDKKFLKSIDSITGTPFTIWSETDLKKGKNGEADTSRLKEHIIVIDEFDSFKKVTLDTIIEDHMMELEPINAFQDIMSKLRDHDSLPKRMVTESDWWDKNRELSIEERLNELMKRAEKIRSKYHTEFLCKSVREDADGKMVDSQSSSFMFRDYEPYTVGNAFTIKTDEKVNYNYIVTGDRVASGTSKVSLMFDQLDSFFNHFCKFMRDLAFNYQDNIREDSDEDHRSLTNCVDTVIDALNLRAELGDYIKMKIIHNRLKSRNDKRAALLEPTMFSRGFSYVSMRDSNSRQLQTHLYYTDYDITPEFILRHMCEETKVIGLSATGEIDSPVCNFSLSYLRDVGVKIHQFNEEEIQEARSIHDSINKGFIDGSSEVVVHYVEDKMSYSVESWKTLFDEDTAEDLYHCVNHPREVYSDDSRYVRFAKALDGFMGLKDARSMLCFFSAHAKESDCGFSRSNLEYVAGKVAKKNGLTVSIEWSDSEKDDSEYDIHLIQIDGSNYSWKIKDVKDLLASGKKVMVITAYQTLGAGQNLQYPIQKGSDLVWIRGTEPTEYDDEADFECIYLDNPTGIAPIVERGDKKSMDGYLFHVESLDAIDQIDINLKRKWIGTAFHRCYSPSGVQPSHFMNTEAYRLAKAKVVIQALGRISRTGWKARKVHIFYDSNLTSYLLSIPMESCGSFIGYEFSVLHKYANSIMYRIEDDKKGLQVSSAIRLTHNLKQLLDDILYAVMYTGDKNAIELWQDLRYFALHHPTGPADISDLPERERNFYRYYYVRLPEGTDRCFFTLKNDFRSDSTDGLDISFGSKPKVMGTEPTKWYEISPETAKLDLMLKIPGVKELLEDLDIPTEFPAGGRIMSPLMFRNIYMGALGELVGLKLIEGAVQYCLNEMPDEFYEQFDYMIEDGVFVDFKDWNESMYGDEKSTEKFTDHIFKKMDRCNASTVYVINIVVDGKREYKPIVTYDRDHKSIVVVPYLYTIKNGHAVPNDTAFDYLANEVGE